MNKYIDGWPHLVALMELSASGMLVRKLHEPDLRRDYFPIELALPWRPTEERIWLWTRTVRESGGAQALRFLGMSDEERATIEAIVREVRTAA